ncbi:hypothetical protein GGR53DRAFT_517672 [Hypoxylon sp. FL1150]|nr:hypothetical protein GGR53DRAFT_517672 [Hypoxylon sp. FL1150]
MLPNSELGAPRQANATESNDGNQPRRRRVRTSCIECRKKKLSCDRNLPCQRCVRSRRPEQCSFEAVELLPSPGHQQQQIRGLRAEVAGLKAALSEIQGARRTANSHEPPFSGSNLPTVLNGNPQGGESLANNHGHGEGALGVISDGQLNSDAISPEGNPSHIPAPVSNKELSNPQERSPLGFYSQHSLFKFFGEIPELFPFIQETASEWFEPLGVDLMKNKPTRNEGNTKPSSQQEVALESLIPPKDDTDTLVTFYLDHVEQLHRVVHIPTFRRKYADFWTPQIPRHPAMTAIILAMISISTYAFTDSGDISSISIRYRVMPVQWISACEEWLRHQSVKHRKLAYYQISCLVYLAKRVNMIGKKRWWKDSSSLIQDAILDGLHCDPASKNDTPCLREMKRRIWNMIRELDLQNSFESCLPTLLHNIDSNVVPPANLDDEGFDEATKGLPASKPLNEYTFTSYQVHSSRSWSLRLEISQRLFSTRFSDALGYDEVMRYTHEITQAIEAIPSWDVRETNDQEHKLSPLARAYLLFQLKECVLALHRPYLQKKEGRFWLSETVCYHTARDILLLHTKLVQLGLQSLTVLRSDLMLASLSLVRLTMLQTKVTTSTIIADLQSTIDLLEGCLPFMEAIYLRCCLGEPWCFVTMCGAIMVLKIHLGKEARQTAKASFARLFLDLHYKHVGRKRATNSNQWYPTATGSDNHANSPLYHLVAPGATSLPATDWLGSNYRELGMDSFELDIDMDGTWDIWETQDT